MSNLIVVALAVSICQAWGYPLQKQDAMLFATIAGIADGGRLVRWYQKVIAGLKS